MQRTAWLDNFISVYRDLNTDNLSTLSTIYHPRVVFIDPLHRSDGVKALIDSFQHSYTNITHCNFAIEHVFHNGNEAAVYWTMTFNHNTLNNRKPVSVAGHSHLKAEDDLIIFHRDYLDVGSMIYEHVPVLGPFVKMIKTRAVKR
ncbi:nuclear transport factor 2 family protein [Vibrio makurazakiensis]|uniref:nuclear transport factor 2 family protein n=1 Tax=Vibrio makurazakiensis TaxID=2910250 RepID=UPI003D0CD145